jgi:hypothetical protein
LHLKALSKLRPGTGAAQRKALCTGAIRAPARLALVPSHAKCVAPDAPGVDFAVMRNSKKKPLAAPTGVEGRSAALLVAQALH